MYPKLVYTLIHYVYQLYTLDEELRGRGEEAHHRPGLRKPHHNHAHTGTVYTQLIIYLCVLEHICVYNLITIVSNIRSQMQKLKVHTESALLTMDQVTILIIPHIYTYRLYTHIYAYVIYIGARLQSAYYGGDSSYACDTVLRLVYFTLATYILAHANIRCAV